MARLLPLNPMWLCGHLYWPLVIMRTRICSVLVEGRACGRRASCVPGHLHMVPHPGRLSTHIGFTDSSVNPSWCILHVPWSPMACATVRRSASMQVLARSRLDRKLRDGDCRGRITQRGRGSMIAGSKAPENTSCVLLDACDSNRFDTYI